MMNYYDWDGPEEKQENKLQQVTKDQQQIQKKIQFTGDYTIVAHNEITLKDLIKDFTQFLQQLKENKQKLVQGFFNIEQNNKMQQDIIDLIEKTNYEINSLKSSLSTIGDKFKPGIQTEQYRGDCNDLIPFNISDQENKKIKQNLIGDQQQNLLHNKFQNDKNDNYVKGKETCIINHGQIKKFSNDYQQIIKFQLEQQLKSNKKSLKCICNQNIKFIDLSISNQNLFEIIQNQQLESIFNDQRQNQVLKCTNNFCNFRCFELKSSNKLEQVVLKYYCPCCNENSIISMKNLDQYYYQ